MSSRTLPEGVARFSPDVIANHQLQEAVTAANDTSNRFSDEVLKEHEIFELSKQQEMKELLKRYADGQVEMLQRAMDDWDRVSGLLGRANFREL